MLRQLLAYPVLLACLVVPAAAQQRVEVLRQVTGPMQTNSYLLYDVETRHAALIDPGGAVDTLTAAIDALGLRVKYILTTHAHSDHVYGVPALRARYPRAKWVLARQELEDTALYAHLEELLPAAEVEVMRQRIAADPDLEAMIRFDYSRLGTPDALLDDAQYLPLGNVLIRTFVTPGHSRGSVCLFADGILFSGDVLFRGTTGRTDLPGSGGPGMMQASVRRLGSELPASTRVMPGHGPPTDLIAELSTSARPIRQR